ncbi:hypothetical protein, partial [Paraburkholderia sp. SIMBA_027]|uniref:hypothetical protein n=1 Tax=Paraburkholderia sp. SIMBA_027 TaxID=3085770 RepID=UPI00397B6A41
RGGVPADLTRLLRQSADQTTQLNIAASEDRASAATTYPDPRRVDLMKIVVLANEGPDICRDRMWVWRLAAPSAKRRTDCSIRSANVPS